MDANKLELIIDIELDGIDTKDFPDFTDAFIVNASWSNTGKELTDEEVEELNSNHSDFVYEEVLKKLY